MTTTPTQKAGSPVDHGSRAHAKHSPSSLKYKELCPHWANQNSDNRHTEMGERMHEAMEKWLRREPDAGADLPELEQFLLAQCQAYVEPLLAGNTGVKIEELTQMADLYLGPLTAGTPDLQIFYDRDKMHIVDYKFGYRAVDPAATNLQAYAYILACFDMNLHVNHIAFHFLSPRRVEETSVAEFTRDDYARLMARVATTVERAEDPAQEYKASWAACAYCGNKANCPAHALLLSQTYISKDTEQAAPLTPDNLIEAMAADTPDKRARLYLATDVVSGWVDQQRSRIMQQALEGNEVLGYELRFRNGRTSVTNLEAVKKSLKKFKIPLDEFAKHATVSLTDLEGIVCGETKAKERTARKREMMSLLASGSALKTGEEQPYLHRTN